MTKFLRSSDAFISSIEGDPGLRSTIVVLVLLDRPPDWRELVKRFELLSRTVPVFRQRVVPSPGLAPPRWEVDDELDLAYHLRRVDAPAPGNMAFLEEMARIAVMAEFDRIRPLWECTLVEGLSDGGAALMCKLNHALTDGVGAVRMAAILYDSTPSSGETTVPRKAATATPTSTRIRELCYGAVGYAVGVVKASQAIPTGVVTVIRNPRQTVAEACETAASIWRVARPTWGPGSPIMVQRHNGRRLATAHVSTERLHDAGVRAGGSLNDAFIAAVTGGLRRYHEKHGASVE